MRGKLLELLLYPAPPFDGEFQVLPEFSPGPLSVRVQNLEKPRDGFPDRSLVPSGKMRS